MKTKINNFEEEVYYEKLKNGLNVYLVPMKYKKTYFALMGVKYGGYHTSFKIDNKINNTPMGIAHFLEHKLFEQNDSPFDFYAKSGTDVNASTTEDRTSYYFYGSNNFKENLDYLLNWIPNFKVTKEQVEKEKGIILEESRMYEDNPDRCLYEKINYNTFNIHPYKYKTIGTHDSIKNITKEDLEKCYKSFYRPDNMYLILTGAFDENKTLKQIKNTLKDYNNPDNLVEDINYDEEDKVYKEYESINMNTTINKVAISYKMNKKIFNELKLSKYELDYYFNMFLTLGFGKISNFYEKSYKKELFNYISYNICDTNKHYVMYFYIDTNKPKEIIKEIENYMKNVELLKEDFIRKIKTWIASEIQLSDSPKSIGSDIESDIIEYNEYKYNKIKDIRKLTYENLIKVYKKMNFNNKSILEINPNSSK